MKETVEGRTRDELLEELEKARKRVRDLEDEVAEQVEWGAGVVSEREFQRTLTRLLQKASMILQCEKCVILVYNREAGELEAQTPAVGLNDDQIKLFRVRATEGISGEVFRTGEALIFNDPISDPKTIKENVALLGIRNGMCVPLVVETKDEDQVVIDRHTIGVLLSFNKRRGEDFATEDLRLFKILARSAAAVITNANIFRTLREKTKTYEATFESLLSGIVVVSASGGIRLINLAAKRLFHLPVEVQPIGQDYRDLVHHEAVREIISRTLAEQQELQGEFTLDGADRYFQVQTAVIRDEEHVAGVVAIIHDVTEVRNLERMRSNFFSTVSQELRSPLASILGFTRTLLEDREEFFDSEVRHEFLSIVEHECNRINRLVTDILHVSRIDEGRALELHPKRVDLAELIDRVVAAQRSYATTHSFRIDLAPEVTSTPIVADEDKVDQILTNLLSNAIKYSPQGGDITISGQLGEGRVEVCISDEGIGIPSDQIRRVFERFHRVETTDQRRTAGTGIGLYIVKHLVEAHGGNIWVESEPGQGSHFYFTLPLRPSTHDV